MNDDENFQKCQNQMINAIININKQQIKSTFVFMFFSSNESNAFIDLNFFFRIFVDCKFRKQLLFSISVMD